VPVIDQQPPFDPVVSLCETAKRLWSRMDASYYNVSAAVRDHPAPSALIADAQAAADDLGRQYDELCDRICKTEARTLAGVFAKLRCATRCIRDVLPEGKDPEQTCDIELRFVLAVERDVRRLITDAQRSKRGPRPGLTSRNRQTSSRAAARGDLGTASEPGCVD
jgi:hypothetical protein